MSHAESALARFAQGYNCSQAVLSGYAGQFGLDEETAMKISSGFGGGMGRMADTCGAVTGAFMVLGKYGQNSPDPDAKETDLRADQGFCRAVQGTQWIARLPGLTAVAT